jgi:hypothetical protein
LRASVLIVGRQTACCLRRVLDAHRDVEPIEDWWRRDPGIDQDRPQTGTAVGERGHFSIVGSANGSKVLADQRRDVSVSLGDRSEHLPASARSFDISDADLQVPFTRFATADEGRIHADSDRSRCRRCWLVRARGPKLLADPQRMVAQCLGAPAGVNRQQVLQDAGCDAIAHQGGKVSLQLVQLWCRSASRWPTHTRLGVIAGRAQKPRKPHCHFAEQRRDAVPPPVLQVAFSAAGPATRPQQPVAVGLPRNDRPLNARQKLLRFGQRQTQVRDLVKTFRPVDLYQICAQAAGIIADRNQPQYPSHPRSPSRLSTRPIVPLVSSSPHSLDTPAPTTTTRDGGVSGIR